MTRRGGGLIIAMLLLLAALPARAEAVRLSYEVNIGGLHVADALVSVTMAEDHYTVTTDFATRGVAAALTGFTAEATSEGRVADGLQPRRHVQETVWRGEPRRVALTYPAPGSAPATEVSPPPDAEEREPVPEAERRATLDPLSASLDVLRAVATEGTGAATVFDGRRLYRLSGTEGAPVAVAEEAYGGPGWAAQLTFERMGGRSSSPFFKRAEGPRHGDVLLAPGPALGLPDALRVPVKVTVPDVGPGSLVVLLRTVRTGEVSP